MRIIDADSVKLPEGFFEKVDNVPKFYDWLNSLPTIDAVEVVRCENCKWRNKQGRCTYIAQIYPFVAKDHFCKYGEPQE